MRVLWCDRELARANTPAFHQLRMEIRERITSSGGEMNWLLSPHEYDMPKEWREENYDVIVFGPFVADLKKWQNSGDYKKIPKVMICSDPQSDISFHVYYAKKYKIKNLWMMYPSWIEQYQKYLSDCKYDNLIWSLNDVHANSDKPIRLAFADANSPFYPLRFEMGNEYQKLLDTYGRIVKFGIPPERLEWKQYIEMLNRSKMLMFDSSFHSIGILKYVEGMTCECCMLAPQPACEDLLHLKPLENYVPVTLEDWRTKLDEMMKDPESVKRIAANGYATFKQYHTTQIRAKEVIEKLEKIVNE